MALSAFDDKQKKPRASDLDEMLGRTSTHWNDLTSHVAAEYPPMEATWGFPGAKYGWSLRLEQKKRTVLYMTPCEKHFLVGFVLGEKAVRAARESRLPESVLTVIDSATKYAEGHGIRLAIRNKKDLAIAKTLAAVKMAS